MTYDFLRSFATTYDTMGRKLQIRQCPKIWTPVYADETGLDVATYIQIYNAAGFLMQVEIDWVQRMIWRAKKPVITIKPLAAGKIPPLVGLAFSWSTIRDQDMVCTISLAEHKGLELNSISARIYRQSLDIYHFCGTLKPINS